MDDFLSIIYPNLCICCDNLLVKSEKLICTTCNIGLPRTHFHLTQNNPIEQIFWGRIPIEKATSFFIFKKGSRYQKIMHYLKYKGFRDIGIEMGRLFGADLKEVSYFDEIDIIVPVPLHRKKERKRGYNQSMAIAEGLSLNIEREISANNLFRRFYSDSQTRKGRYERWENVSELFGVHHPELFHNKHILLVDDVVTTGATLEACANAVKKCQNTKVSIATLAFASI
jgi:ComF family protein